MDRWKCTICGYIYDQATGDPDSGVKAGTAFEDIPNDWRCPKCGAMRKWFDKVKS